MHNVLYSPPIQSYIRLLQAARDAEVIDVQKEIAEAAPVSIRILKEAQLDENFPKRERVKVAQDILDRAGDSKITKAVVTHESSNNIRALLDRVKKHMIETEAEVMADD